ncbi:MAG TPA: AmpG family muropeptide MFS transporter [Azospirillaceae bacterium]|nr:AmpG family muropeptide MFS transporter [Azospirillaceae bacterium]
MFASSWLHSAAVYGDRRILTVLFLGFASGLPLALTASTLSYWLNDHGLSLTAIGLFSLVGLPYSFKFAWAPLIDRLPLPLLTRRLGQRRGWALIAQAALMASLWGMGSTDPAADPWWTAFFAVLVAFSSASQDIVIDALRVEMLDEDQQGAGAGTIVLGYRLGMLAAGAGALFLADQIAWPDVYRVMAALVGIGMVTVLLTPEPKRVARPAPERTTLVGWLKDAVIGPFAQFMARRGWLVILLFITLYKLGDVMAGTMSGPFYRGLGFEKSEIASIAKVFGLIATIAGGLLGGIVVSRLGTVRALFFSGVLQMLSNLSYSALAFAGHDMTMLTAQIAIENLTGGMATIALVAYLSSLCNVAYTATQYALLTSFAALARDFLGASAGWFAERMDWVSYFIFTAGAALPALVVLVWLVTRFKPVVTAEAD